MPGAAGFVDPSYAATGEIVAELFALAEAPLTKEAAHCLYVAQTTDTGGYRFSNTNARSHRIAARLVDTGIDVAEISNRVFECMPRPKFELLRCVVSRMEIAAGGKLAHSYVTAQDLSEASAAKEHLDGLVNFARNIEGVRVGALFNGVEPEKTKVSLRADGPFNAAEFLREEYGGGGHAAAAGATVERPLAELRDEMVAKLEQALTEEEKDEAE